MKYLIIVTFLLTSTLSFGQKEIAHLDIKTSAVCDQCKERIEYQMKFEKGLKTAVLDVESKILAIDYRPDKTSPEKLKAALTKIGYDADELRADPKAYEKLDACCKGGSCHGSRRRTPRRRTSSPLI